MSIVSTPGFEFLALILDSYKLVRGALDFAGVVNRATSRSRYGYVARAFAPVMQFTCFTVPRSLNESKLLILSNACWQIIILLWRDIHPTCSLYFTRFPVSRRASSRGFCALTIFSISEFMAQHQASRSRTLLVLKTRVFCFAERFGIPFPCTGVVVGSCSAFIIWGYFRYLMMNIISSSRSSVSSPS